MGVRLCVLCNTQVHTQYNSRGVKSSDKNTGKVRRLGWEIFVIFRGVVCDSLSGDNFQAET